MNWKNNCFISYFLINTMTSIFLGQNLLLFATLHKILYFIKRYLKRFSNFKNTVSFCTNKIKQGPLLKNPSLLASAEEI